MGFQVRAQKYPDLRFRPQHEYRLHPQHDLDNNPRIFPANPPHTGAGVHPQTYRNPDHIGQTLRLQNLPAATTEQDILEFFDAQLITPLSQLGFGIPQKDHPLNTPTLAQNPAGVHPWIQRVGAIYSGPNSEEQWATVTFWSHSLANWGKWCSNREFRNSRGSVSVVQIDDGFLGLTTIYSSNNSRDLETNLHVVAVHGLHGHAYNSYSTRQSVGSIGAEETMWLRDMLPTALQQYGISPWITTYGYRTDLSDESSAHFLDKIPTELESALRHERALFDPTIPIVFLSHSFGGFIVKKTVSSMTSWANSVSYPSSPVSGCVFFGTQHDQMKSQSAMMTLLFPLDEPQPTRIRLAKIRRQTAVLVNDINRQFEKCIKGEPSMKIVTCYETKKTKGIFLVDKKTSSLNSPNAKLVPVYANHKDLIRPNSTTGHSNPDFLKAIAEVAGEAVRLRSQSVTVPTHLTHPDLRASSLSSLTLTENSTWGHSTASTRATSPAESLDNFFLGEDSSAYLSRFETIVLADDSDSMWGPRWHQASDLLAGMAQVVARYDPNGFKLHFFNQEFYDQEQPTTPELIRKLFEIVEPIGGSTPTATLLERELSKYISRYRSNNKLRGLNLLVVTDGVPDNENEVSEVISQASKEMEVLRARRGQISIQFIQIGSDESLQMFLKRLDDDFSVGFPSDHIVVDRIPWEPEQSDVLLRKVLFGGIRQHYDDEAFEYATRSSNRKSLNILQSSKLFERRKYQLETPSIREVLLAAVTKCSPSIVGHEEYYCTTFDLTWELLAFVRDNLGEDEKLSRVVTLTGTQINAQASTCEEYIRKLWPDLGPPLLSFIEDTCDQCLRQSGFSEVSTTTKLQRRGFPSIALRINVKSGKTIVEVHGPLECQIQVTEILAWLTAAVRASTPPSLSNSEASLTFEDYESDSTGACFKLQPKPLNPIRNGSQMCWHPLFEHSVIAVQFPYAQRTQGVGVELSPFLMATLAGIRTAVEFRGGLILRGLSTALIPLETTEGEDAIQWHLATTKTSDDALTTDLLVDLDEIEGIDGYYKVQDVQQLWAKKAYLGWCSVATVLLGTREARYQKVTWSDPSKVRRHIDLSEFSLSFGSSGMGIAGVTGTAKYVIPRAQRTHFMDVEEQLEDRLRISMYRPVIVYDTLDQRGWMIPTVCLMLYMMHLRIQKLYKPPGASKDDINPMLYSSTDKEAAQDAYEILSRNMKPHIASTKADSKEWKDNLDSEKWKDILAIFYIALDAFFSKSNELSSQSSASSSEISGFELMDAVLAEKPFRYNARQIQSNSGGWAELRDNVGILFCRGIGDAIVPGKGANVLCKPWSSVPSGFNYLGAYVPCVIEVLTRQGKHKGSERLRQRIGYDLYHTCRHTEKSQCSHLQTYREIADPPDDKKKRVIRVTKNETPPSAEDLLNHRGAIIFGKTSTLVKARPVT